MKKILFMVLIMLMVGTMTFGLPEMDPKNNLAYCVKDYLKSTLVDATSLEVLEVSEMLALSNGEFIQIVYFKSKNAFGAYMTNQYFYLISKDDVVEAAFETQDDAILYMALVGAEVTAGYDYNGNVIE